MPASPSSPVDPSIGHLVAIAQDATPGDRVDLLTVFARVADPRKPRGVRHRLAVILALSVCAVLAGARSFVAIAEWAADADATALAGLGGVLVVPSESTFRGTLQSLDADAFDALLGAWSQTRTISTTGARRRIAVDGKTVRGSGAAIDTGTGRRTSRHLLAAFDHTHGVVLGQVDVEAKINEIPLFSTLLDTIDIARCRPPTPCPKPSASSGRSREASAKPHCSSACSPPWSRSVWPSRWPPAT